MTNKEIEDQINADFGKFNNDVYKGAISTPGNIIELFKRGVKALAPQYHKVFANRIKTICNREVKDITTGELSDVIKIIVNTPFDKLYDVDFDKAVDKQINFEKFMLSYNNYVSEFQKKLEMKRANLLSLVRGVPNNGMKIIN